MDPEQDPHLAADQHLGRGAKASNKRKNELTYN